MVSTSKGWAFSILGVVRTTDGGHLWKLVSPSNLPKTQPLPCGGYPGAVSLFATGPDRAWFARSCDSSSEQLTNQITVWRTTNAGLTWSSTILVGHGIQGPNDIDLDFLERGPGWVAPESTSGGGVAIESLFATRDGGARWTSIFSNESARNLLGFSSETQGYGFSEREYPNASDFSDFPLVTSDGGLTWDHRSVPIPAGYDTGAIDVGSAGFSGANSAAIPVMLFHTSPIGGYLFTTYLTRDGGLHWSHTAVLHGRLLGDFFSATDGWTEDGKSLMHTTNSGRSWSRVADNVPAALGGYAFVTPKVGFMIGSDPSNGRGGILFTRNVGRAWSFIDPRLVRS